MKPTKPTPKRKIEIAAGTQTPLEVKTILVPVDFSDNSLAALRYSIRFAARFGAALRIIHVIEPPTFMSNIQNVPLVLSNEQVAAQTHKELDSLVASHVPDSITSSKVVRTGVPYDEIVSEARQTGVDLIIIATHGYSGLKHAVMGSTAERVVRHAPCPVLVVRESK